MSADDRTRLTTVDAVHEEGSWLFTIEDQYGAEDEVILVPCEESVEAWINRCTHEAQRLDRGFGAAIRNGQIVCPKHGSMFESCSGACDNGEAAGTRLVPVDVAVEDGTVYLTEDGVRFHHEGGIGDGDDAAPDAREGGDGADGDGGDDDDDDMPSSTSHIGF